MKLQPTLLLILILLLSCRKDKAIDEGPQKMWNFSSSTFGGTLGDAAHDLCYSNGKIFVVGSTASFGNGMTDIYLVVLDTALNVLNDNYIGTTNVEAGTSIFPTTTGAIIAGYTDFYGNRQAYLVNVDVNGDTLWTQHYNFDTQSVAYNVNSDGTNYFITGNSVDASGNNQMLVAKTDNSGNLIWSKTYGGTSVELGTDIEILSSGDLLICGFTNSYGSGDRDLMVMKTNSNGDSLQTLLLGGAGYEQPGYMQKTSSGNFLITGHTASTEPNHNFYFGLIDQNFNVIWQGEKGDMMHDGAEAIIETEDGVVCIGHSTSNSMADSDVMVVDLNYNGSPTGVSYNGNSADEYVYSIIRIGNSYYMAGTTETGGNMDVLLVKMNPGG